MKAGLADTREPSSPCSPAGRVHGAMNPGPRQEGVACKLSQGPRVGWTGEAEGAVYVLQLHFPPLARLLPPPLNWVPNSSPCSATDSECDPEQATHNLSKPWGEG